jgi:Zn-dependent peptidase ImmA (M78 family)
MPMRVKAFCKLVDNEDCVVLNQDLSDERKFEAIEHEILHFTRNDLFSDSSVAEIEDRLRR